MRSRSNGGVIGAYALPTKNYANGVFFIHDAAIYNTGANPIWPINSGYLLNVSTTGTVTIDSNDSNYKLVTFTANGSFQVTTGSAEIEMLIVGGGGGGGMSFVNSGGATQAGGGGGSGAVVNVRQWINPGTTITVTVGTGGTGGTSSVNPTSGKTSRTVCSEFSYYALGGGSGSSYSSGAGTQAPAQGGSGGGSGGQDVATTYKTSLQNTTYGYGYGHDGGSQLISGTYRVSSGGGGGAGAVGGNGISAPNIGGENGDGGYGYYWNRTNTYYASGGPGAYCDNTGVYSLNVIKAGLMYDASNTASRQTLFDSVPSQQTYGGGGPTASLWYRSSINYGTTSGGDGRNGIVYIRYRYK